MHVHELADYNDTDNSLMSVTQHCNVNTVHTSIHVHELADYNDTTDNTPYVIMN